MADKSSERVLGIPTSRLREAGLFQGFRPFDSHLLAFLLDRKHLEYRMRGTAENDPEFKQLIPYVVLRHGESVFHYTRGQSGAESRLRALRSIGVGGHISAEDDANAADPYRAGMLRELHEEVYVRSVYREQAYGLINDDSTAVGSVHLGVVHLLDLEAPNVEPRETGIAMAGFAPIADLLGQSDQFETWSQIVLRSV